MKYLNSNPGDEMSKYRGCCLVSNFKKEINYSLLLLIIISLYNLECDAQFLPFPPNPFLTRDLSAAFRPLTNFLDTNIYGRTNSRPAPNIIRQSVQRKPASPARQCRINKACPDLGHGTTISPSWRTTTTTNAPALTTIPSTNHIATNVTLYTSTTKAPARTVTTTKTPSTNPVTTTKTPSTIAANTTKMPSTIAANTTKMPSTTHANSTIAGLTNTNTMIGHSRTNITTISTPTTSVAS